MQITIQNLLEHSDFKCFRTAYSIAQEAHKNQKRKDGKPYMTHVDAVINGVIDYSLDSGECFREVYNKEEVWVPYFDVLLSVAALHDVYEDHKDKFSLEGIRDIFSVRGIEENEINPILKSVDAISKKPKGEEEYWKYVSRVMEDTDASIVKICDLKHNMSDLEPGNMLDKYSLTLAVLNFEFC
jgi:GTP diphosphokinase / guanosine-3',5'-bis(diphosphate) 3'-diphosphatase